MVRKASYSRAQIKSNSRGNSELSRLPETTSGVGFTESTLRWLILPELLMDGFLLRAFNQEGKQQQPPQGLTDR